eukprot:s1115_g5.t1
MSLSKVPVEDELARMWEADLRIRERMRFNDGKLLVWPKNKQDKEMVSALRRLCAVSPDLGVLQCDSWGVKKLFSYGCRRAGFDKTLCKSPQRREIGVNDFYEEIFKWWSLKLRKSGSSASLDSRGSEVIELDDSGDESGDLSIIMEVKVKKECGKVSAGDCQENLADVVAAVDPYVAVDPYMETGRMSAELQEYTESTMAILNEAMDAEAEAEVEAASIYLAPEYPPESQILEAKEADPGHQLPQPAVATEAEVPPPGALLKGFKSIDAKACTVKDVEERIRFLQHFGVKSISSYLCLFGSFERPVFFLFDAIQGHLVMIHLRGLLQKKKDAAATDVADTLPFDPSPVASALKKQLSEIELVDSQDSSPKASQVCRSLAHEFSDVKSGTV